MGGAQQSVPSILESIKFEVGFFKDFERSMLRFQDWDSNVLLVTSLSLQLLFFDGLIIVFFS